MHAGVHLTLFHVFNSTYKNQPLIRHIAFVSIHMKLVFLEKPKRFQGGPLLHPTITNSTQKKKKCTLAHVYELVTKRDVTWLQSDMKQDHFVMFLFERRVTIRMELLHDLQCAWVLNLECYDFLFCMSFMLGSTGIACFFSSLAVVVNNCCALDLHVYRCECE